METAARLPLLVLLVILLAAGLGSALHLARAARRRRRAAESARRDLDQFFALSPDLLCIADTEGYFRRLNLAWTSTLGYPVEELCARPFLDFVHPEDRERTFAELSRLRQGLEVRNFENRYRGRDGFWHWIVWNCATGPDGRTVYAAAHDITERKIAEAALRRTQEQLEGRVAERTAELAQREESFRRLFEGAPIGIAVVEPGSFRLLRVNRALAEMVGYSEQELIGVSILDLTHPDDVGRSRENFTRLVQGGIGSNSIEKRCLTKSGQAIWVNLTVSGLRSTLGQTSGVMGMVENITERKLHEQEIARLTAALQARVTELTEVNRELEAFTYSVSHDLRAPLRHIDGFSRILLEEAGPQLPAAAQRCLDHIRDGTRQMGRMVDELLELARMSRREPHRILTSLRALVEEARAELRADTGGRDIEWRIHELPSADCDPDLLRQVFVNLLANAVKFTRPRRHAVIEVGQEPTEAGPAVYVRDNGVGFSMKYASKLFGAFQRLHRREDFEGTGVGLATVQRIVHKHGGRVWADAQLDRGATFYFTLGGAGPEGEPVPAAAAPGVRS